MDHIEAMSARSSARSPSGSDAERPAAGGPSALTPAEYYRGQNLEERWGGQDCVPGQVFIDEVGFDWVTLTGATADLDSARDLLGSLGVKLVNRDGGVKFYKKAVDLDVGGILAWGHRAGHDSWMLQLPGDAWAREHRQCLAVIRRLWGSLSLKCSRLDVRRDQYGLQLPFISQAIEACKSGCLCRARQFKPHEPGLAAKPDHRVGLGLEMGSRQSSYFVRWYDKGLQQDALPEGSWLRYEVETKGSTATAILHGCVSAENWKAMAVQSLVAAVDFRYPSTSNRTISERKRLEWWSVWCKEAVGVRACSPRAPTDLQGYRKWLAGCVGPTLEAIRNRTGLSSVGAVFDALIAGEFVRPCLPRPVVEQAGQWLVVAEHETA